jgi:hypothetical protein
MIVVSLTTGVTACSCEYALVARKVNSHNIIAAGRSALFNYLFFYYYLIFVPSTKTANSYKG